MKPLRALSAFALSLAILISAGCQSAATTSGDAAAGAKVLRVGVTSSLAPMAFKQGGELGKQLGRPVEFIEVKWEDQIPALHESDGLGVVPQQLTNETLGWAVRPNDFIAARQANGSLNAMIKRWLPLAN